MLGGSVARLGKDLTDLHPQLKELEELEEEESSRRLQELFCLVFARYQDDDSLKRLQVLEGDAPILELCPNFEHHCFLLHTRKQEHRLEASPCQEEGVASLAEQSTEQQVASPPTSILSAAAAAGDTDASEGEQTCQHICSPSPQLPLLLLSLSFSPIFPLLSPLLPSPPSLLLLLHLSELPVP